MGRKQLREGGELEVDVEEDSSDEPELDPIRIQLAFIKIARGKNEEAEKEILVVLSHHGISKIIASIATCNLAACRGSKEAADSLKRYGESRASNILRLKSFPADVIKKLTLQQRSAIQFNIAVLLPLLNRVTELESSES